MPGKLTTMWFRKRKATAQAESHEALAAKIQADIDQKVARDRLAEVSKQAEELIRINQTNHFSEGLTKAFRGRTI